MEWILERHQILEIGVEMKPSKFPALSNVVVKARSDELIHHLPTINIWKVGNVSYSGEELGFAHAKCKVSHTATSRKAGKLLWSSILGKRSLETLPVRHEKERFAWSWELLWVLFFVVFKRRNRKLEDNFPFWLKIMWLSRENEFRYSSCLKWGLLDEDDTFY